MLYVSAVDAVLEPTVGEVRRCTLAAVDGECRLLAPDGAGSLGEGRVLDGAGLVAVPGLIDAHAHWGAAARQRWGTAAPAPHAMGGEFAAFLPAERTACLEHGVTSVVSMGDALDWILGMRAAAVGPRMFAVGPIFTAPGGHPAGDLFRGNDWLVAQSCRQFPAGMAAAAAGEVRALAGRGVDAIKVVYDDGRGTLPRLDDGVLGAIIAAAHTCGLLVHAHVGTCAEALTALALGADWLEHVPDPQGTAGWEQVAAALRARRAGICPTLVALASVALGEAVEAMARWVAGLATSGVPVTVGTDLGNFALAPGAAVHDEIAWLIRGGMSAGQALAAATTVPGGQLLPGCGRIANGTRADWALVRGDPLHDPGVLRQPALVILGGRIVAGTEREGWGV